MNHLLVIHGASVAGKATALRHLVETHGYHTVPRYTARAIHPDEKDKRFKRQPADRIVATCDIIHWVGDHVYGLRSREIRDVLVRSNAAVVVGNFESVRTLAAHFPSARAIWIERDLSEQQARTLLRNRGASDLEIMLQFQRTRALEAEYPWHAGLFEFVAKNDGSKLWLHRQLDAYVLSLRISRRDELLLLPQRHLPLLSDARILTVAESIQARLLVHHPEELRRLESRQFEVFVASLLAEEGYDVRITPQTRDGGFDIIAVRSDGFFPQLYLVECKRYSQSRPVGVQPVRQLYGLVGSHHANGAVLVTTSRFTKDALAFQETVGYQMSLRDYDVLVEWLARLRDG